MAITPRRSVALFALLSIAMVIFSYLLVIGLAAACVYLPYLMIANMEHPQAQIAILFLGGIVVAGAMLWSLVPRREKFEAPGALLERDSHPRLFAELDDIAASLNEPLPGEAYLIGQVNTFVAHRGGILGFGSRRIMRSACHFFPCSTSLSFEASWRIMSLVTTTAGTRVSARGFTRHRRR